VELFTWEGRRRVPVPDAVEVHRYAERVLAQTGDLARWLQARSSGVSGPLHVGMIDAAAVHHFPDVLRTHRREHPHVDLRLSVAPTGSLLRLLHRGIIDLAVGVDPGPVEGVACTALLDEPLAVYAPDGVTNRRPASWGPWVTFPAGSMTRSVIADAVRLAGAPFEVIAESHQPEVLREMVRLGMGWAVLPVSQAEGTPPLRRARAAPIATRRLVVRATARRTATADGRRSRAGARACCGPTAGIRARSAGDAHRAVTITGHVGDAEVGEHRLLDVIVHAVGEDLCAQPPARPTAAATARRARGIAGDRAHHLRLDDERVDARLGELPQGHGRRHQHVGGQPTPTFRTPTSASPPPIERAVAAAAGTSSGDTIERRDPAASSTSASRPGRNGSDSVRAVTGTSAAGAAPSSSRSTSRTADRRTVRSSASATAVRSTCGRNACSGTATPSRIQCGNVLHDVTTPSARRTIGWYPPVTATLAERDGQLVHDLVVRPRLVPGGGHLQAGAPALRPVHRGVGATEQLRRRQRAVDTDGHTEGRTDGDRRTVVHDEAVGDGGPQPFGELPGVVRAGHRVADDDELVTAETGDGVAWPDGAGQPCRDLPQQRVASGVPQHVVHRLQPVDVGEHHRHHAAGATGPPQGEVEAVVEERPVREAGEVVLRRPPRRRRIDLARHGGERHDLGSRDPTPPPPSPRTGPRPRSGPHRHHAGPPAL
jgi:DNA-binding transcriptional LysR family regulator